MLIDDEIKPPETKDEDYVCFIERKQEKAKGSSFQMK